VETWSVGRDLLGDERDEQRVGAQTRHRRGHVRTDGALAQPFGVDARLDRAEQRAFGAEPRAHEVGERDDGVQDWSDGPEQRPHGVGEGSADADDWPNEVLVSAAGRPKASVPRSSTRELPEAHTHRAVNYSGTGDPARPIAGVMVLSPNCPVRFRGTDRFSFEPSPNWPSKLTLQQRAGGDCDAPYWHRVEGKKLHCIAEQVDTVANLRIVLARWFSHH